MTTTAAPPVPTAEPVGRGRLMSLPSLPVLAVIVTVLLWSSSFVVIRSAGEVFSPGPMALLRLTAGTVVLAVIAVRYRRPLPSGRALVLVVGYGLAWFAGYTVLLNWAEQHLDAGTAALLVNFAPILVAVFAGLFMAEGFPRPLVLGIAIAFVGVVTIAVGGSGGGANDWIGIVLGLITAVLYATGVLMQKVALRTVDAVTATWVGCFAGFLALLPFSGSAINEVSQAPASSILAVIYLGVGPTAIAFTTWAYALTRSDAGKMAATTLVVPAIAILMSWIFLGEVPTIFGFVGGALCLGGVVMSRSRNRAAPAQLNRSIDRNGGSLPTP